MAIFNFSAYFSLLIASQKSNQPWLILFLHAEADISAVDYNKATVE